MSVRRSQGGPSKILIAIGLVIAASLFFVFKPPQLVERLDQFQKGSGVFLSPQQQFEKALEKTIEVDSAYVEFETDVQTKLTNTQVGLTQTLNNNVDGFLTGSTDGSDNHMQIRISSAERPDIEIIVEGISIGIDTDEETHYIKGPATNQKWLKMSKEEFEQDNGQPTDASLYGFEILGTLFSENKALFNAIDRDSISFLGEEEVDNKMLKRFAVEIPVPDFIASLEADEEMDESDLEDAKEILALAVMSAEFVVDTESGYVVSLDIDAKNLKQIDPTNGQLGITQQHDIKLHADISRFGIASNIEAPDEDEVVEANDRVLGVTTSLDFDRLPRE